MIWYLKNKRDKKATLKALSSVCANLSSGWYALIIIAPNFWPITSWKEVLILTEDFILGTLFLWFSIKLERKLL